MNAVEVNALLGHAEKRRTKGDHFAKTEPIPIPLFDGARLPILFEPAYIPEELRAPTLTAFLRLSSGDRTELNRHLYAAFRDSAEIMRDEFGCSSIQEAYEENAKMTGDPVPVLPNGPKEVWGLLQGLDVGLHVSSGRRFAKVRLTCQWDTEHGIAIWYEGGDRLRQVAGWDSYFDHLLDRADQIHPEMGDTIYNAHIDKFRTYRRDK